MERSHENLLPAPTPWMDVINFAGPCSIERVAVILGGVAVVFNVIRLDGPSVFYRDIPCAADRLASRITRDPWAHSRVSEHFRYVIEDELTEGGYDLLGLYTPPERERRKRLCEQVMDELAAFGESWSAKRISIEGC